MRLATALRGPVGSDRLLLTGLVFVRSLGLIATTHPRDVDLSGSGLDVLRILGTNDGSAPPANGALNDGMLPADARRIEIDGANHAGFAYHGPQPGDGRATIPRREQQQRLVSLLIDELEHVAPPDGDASAPRTR